MRAFSRSAGLTSIGTEVGDTIKNWVVINCAHQFLNWGDRATVLKN